MIYDYYGANYTVNNMTVFVVGSVILWYNLLMVQNIFATCLVLSVVITYGQVNRLLISQLLLCNKNPNLVQISFSEMAIDTMIVESNDLLCLKEYYVLLICNEKISKQREFKIK